MNAKAQSELQLEFSDQATKNGFEILQIKNSSNLILRRKKDGLELQCLLKSRWWAEKDLLGRNTWIVFPDGVKSRKRNWYVVPHDLIVQHGKIKHRHTLSWKRGLYHKPQLSEDLVVAYVAYQMDILANLRREFVDLLHLQNAKNWE